MKTLVTVVASALTAQAFAQSLDMNKVGFRGRGGADVPAGTSVVQSEPIILDSTAKFQKTGAGTLEVPFSKIDRKTPYSLVANEGKLKLSVDEESAALPSAPEACQKAAYWVDASSAVTTNGTDGTAFVARWCDVREPAATRELAATPTKVYATPMWFHAPEANQDVPPVLTNKDGKAAVYFGGHLSGKWMQWSSRFENIQHVFLVHGCYDTWGAAIGCSWQNRYGGFVPPFVYPTTLQTSHSAFSKHFWAAPIAEADAFTMTAFLDGMPLDVETVPPKIGFQLLECKYAGALTKADDFFYSSYAEIGGSGSQYKQGGDYISEALVFTVALSEAERLEIERYLMKKWGLDNNRFAYDTATDAKDVIVPAPVGSVGVASGAQVEVAVGEGDSTPPLTFSGEGSVVKTGAGTLVVGASAQESPFAGTFSLQAGDVIARCGALPPVKLSGGVKYTAEAYKSGATANVANTKEAGLRLSCTAASAGNLAVKDGVGWMRASGVADGVECVKVESGVLQLEASAASAAYVAGGAVTAIVANADFEMPYTENANGTSANLPSDYSGADANGWRCMLGTVSYASTQGSYWTVNTGKFARPSGTKVLRATGNASFETVVTFARAGRYELSFDCRSNGGRGTGNRLNDPQQITIKLQGQTGEPVTVGVFAANDGPFLRCRFRLPEVEAGQYALQFYCTESTTVTTFFDDVCVALVGENEEMPAFTIPHGDFESINGAYTDFDGRNTSEGWTFGSDRTYGEVDFELNPPAGVVGRSRWYTESGWWPLRPFLFNVYDAPLGGSCLLFNSSGGTASTTFTAPAGEFRLRAGVSVSAGYLKVGSTAGKYNVRNGSVIEAVLTLANGTEVNLGTVTATAHLMEQKTWPVGFEIAESQVVTLRLRQTSQSTAFVDDLVFVGDSRGCEGNLVKNPGFEREFANWSVMAGNASTWPVLYSQSPALYYGYAAAGGMKGTRMSGVGAFLRQDISFPSKGLCRLRVFARPRSEDNNAKSRGNLEFCLVPTGSTVTNVIGRTGVGDVMPRYLQFVEFNYLFRIDAAGEYAFVIRKLGEDGSRDTYVDDVSITCVKEDLADFRMPSTLKIDVSEGAKLRLDFTNTVVSGKVKLGGRTVYGLLNEQTYPEYIEGLGTILARERGFAITFR